jgi:hypothetical protein
MILNLTQHNASADQIINQVTEVEDKKLLSSLLTFEELPSLETLNANAAQIAALAKSHGCNQAMIGGAPYFMPILARALKNEGIEPLYAFSKRESVESINEAGEVTKTSVFKHAGFVPHYTA